MIHCGQCGSNLLGVHNVDVASPTYFQVQGVWLEHRPKVIMPLVEFWCTCCHHTWEMEGTLQDVLDGKFNEDDDEE
jgi:hypothetical protein